MMKKKPQELETLIGQDSMIRGEIASQGVVRLDGSLEGDIKADCLIIGKTGCVTGNVYARTIIVNGAIEGDLHADEMIELSADGSISGNVHTDKLIVGEGAFFSGTTFMEKTKSADSDNVQTVGHKIRHVFTGLSKNRTINSLEDRQDNESSFNRIS
ncbi:MAG: polymer-forming cytoskeletal protein [Syntrophorhabdus sp.]